MLGAMGKLDSSKAKRAFTLRLTAVREEAGFDKMAPFARALGVASATYRAWERGAAEPGIADLAKIARVTGCSLDFLVAGRSPQAGSPQGFLRQRSDQEAS